MASAGKHTTQAEISFQPSLKNCFVNLPSSIVSALTNSNAVVQNVIVELSFKLPAPTADRTSTKPPNVQKTIYVGWTGYQSKRKLAPVVGSEGLTGGRGGAIREPEVSVVEIDTTFARLVGLNDGKKISIALHFDAPQAHTVNIEPLTPADWEMIELHAQFLELNFLNQIRALPNPTFVAGSGPSHNRHPLTLHLSPTTTANILVSSLMPIPSTSTPFVKISSDAEVIVSPKTRQKAEKSSGRENRSVASTGRRSAGGKSAASTVRRKSGREEGAGRGFIFLRGVSRTLSRDWFDEEVSADDCSLNIWIDGDILSSKALKGVIWVTVSIVRPAGLNEPSDPRKEQEPEKHSSRVVARIQEWDDAPDSRHAALSSALCGALGAPELVGGLVRLEAAPAPSSATSRSQSDPDRSVKVIPFIPSGSQQVGGLKFGGETKQEREDTARRIKDLYRQHNGKGLLDGPLTDGMILPPIAEKDPAWQGGIVKIGSNQPGDKTQQTVWLTVPAGAFNIDVRPGVPKPSTISNAWSPAAQLPSLKPTMVGIDKLVAQLYSHLLQASSILLTGGLGAGKSSVAQLVAHRLRQEHLVNIQYFQCHSLLTEEIRVSQIKDTLSRLFASASWGARLGGRSLIILDDLDRLCPIETELQVGGENGRSRHISECVCSVVREYCSRDSGIVLLATAQSKEAVNNVIIGGHVVREIVNISAPNKEGRRKVLEMLAHKDTRPSNNLKSQMNGHSSDSAGQRHENASNESRPDIPNGPRKDGLTVDCTIDFLDIAGQTDGYMPGDIVLLVSRARSEALIRSTISDHERMPNGSTVILTTGDFTKALKGFTPASLRNVTLQTSTTRWDSIGGLRATRRVLLETLQYPTTYAPIFAECPLRLRSGILLYGYPGCGKTLLASAVAGECGLNFISVKGPEILNKYIGASEKSVRDLFERAEAARPCVLFFDEFDSIAPKRGHDSTGVTDRVVNQLLTQMDGAEGLSGVYVLAATSRPDLIDPALLRPGRLDKSLICDLPGLDERTDILFAVTRNLRLSPSILTSGTEGENLREVAEKTKGYSGADLQAVVYNAQLEAIHDVLGDRTNSQPSRGKGKMAANSRSISNFGKGIADFTYFRFGDDLNAPTSQVRSPPLSERGMISASIASLQASRRRQKQQQSPSTKRHDTNTEAEALDYESDGEPMIEWKHLITALQNSRSSISTQERSRLAAIYQEFVVGRNGEMPNGQGGNEIGGRSSLM
ncbi:AAA-domain-containing protein [Pseudovirgaria hyperparasitica]|uniref:Peroxisomal ATPase PEX1 n=1 Tax=Pseudovirgaria hyperparasitica TaxID=470096 RepID=A0A6A6VT83_9PEZI|nr:AAA-domain-containing protein [Pseudovirgaria hyperparasitica]KAF2752800.1 AAA-domain-containing protein [Pseudovirgaria hyperparasitica]